MRARAERLSLPVRAAVALIAAAALCRIVLGLTTGGDYQLGAPVLADNAAPAVDALIHGHLAMAASHQPLMGLVSLVWRVPFSGAAVWLGGSSHLAYQLGVLGCLVPALGAGWWLAGRARSPAQWAVAAVAAVLIAGGPLTNAAAQLGHPEEALTALLCAAAVICAGLDRRWWSGLLLGLAIGSKPWALLAAPCVLLALPRSRAGIAALATAVAAPTLVLLPLLNPGAYGHAGRVIGSLDYAYPFSIWWPMGARHLSMPGIPAQLLPFSLSRTGAVAIVFALAGAMLCAYARHTAGSWRIPRVDGLALLCLLALLRCLADPAPLPYYFVALAIPLALWEAGIRRRVPVLAIIVSIVVEAAPHDVVAANNGSHGTLVVMILNALWLAAWAALAVYLARSAIRPWVHAGLDGQDEGRPSGWRGSPSSGIGSHAAA